MGCKVFLKVLGVCVLLPDKYSTFSVLASGCVRQMIEHVGVHFSWQYSCPPRISVFFSSLMGFYVIMGEVIWVH